MRVRPGRANRNGVSSRVSPVDDLKQAQSSRDLPDEAEHDVDLTAGDRIHVGLSVANVVAQVLPELEGVRVGGDQVQSALDRRPVMSVGGNEWIPDSDQCSLEP